MCFGVRIAKDNQAQQIAEYAILIALVLAAVIGMKVYVQRGLQARYRGATLLAGMELRHLKNNEQLPLQYEPYYQKSEFNLTSDSRKSERQISPLPVKEKVEKSLNETTTSYGNQELLPGAYGD